MVESDDGAYGECEGVRYQLQPVWKVGTHKCVDASPLLVVNRHKDAITMTTGAVIMNTDTITMETSDIVMETGTNSTIAMDMSEAVVYVGSHSHLFMALEWLTGRVLWGVELGGRVESSATVSACGQFVIVGKGFGLEYPVSLHDVDR